jgi:hypothetical protein
MSCLQVIGALLCAQPVMIARQDVVVKGSLQWGAEFMGDEVNEIGFEPS